MLQKGRLIFLSKSLEKSFMINSMLIFIQKQKLKYANTVKVAMTLFACNRRWTPKLSFPLIFGVFQFKYYINVLTQEWNLVTFAEPSLHNSAKYLFKRGVGIGDSLFMIYQFSKIRWIFTLNCYTFIFYHFRLAVCFII